MGLRAWGVKVAGMSGLALLSGFLCAIVVQDPVREDPPVSGLDPLQVTRLEALCGAIVEPGSPGFSLGIVRDGALIYKRGFGLANLDYDLPNTPATVFEIASVSKQFTAASILLLSRARRISLQDDIRKYLPEMPVYKRPIRIHHLIHHTSGIRDYEILQALKGELSQQGHHTNQDIFELIAAQQGLDFLPGERARYSNSGYTLLAVILERIAGMPLSRFVKENIFGPLGMEHTFILDDNTVIVKNRATGYAPRAGGGFQVDGSLNESTGDGGVYTTVEDLYLWDQNLVNATLDEPGFAAEMLRSGRLSNGRPAILDYAGVPMEYAFGLRKFRYRGEPAFGHGGWYAGFKSVYICFPERRFSVILLANRQDFSPFQCALRISDICLEGSFAEGPPPDTKAESSPEAAAKPSPTFSPADLSAYQGDYWSQELGVTYELRSKDGRLAFVQEGAPEDAGLEPKADDLFSYWGMSLRFQRGPGGSITGFTIESEEVKGLSFIRKR